MICLRRYRLVRTWGLPLAASMTSAFACSTRKNIDNVPQPFAYTAQNDPTTSSDETSQLTLITHSAPFPTARAALEPDLEHTTRASSSSPSPASEASSLPVAAGNSRAGAKRRPGIYINGDLVAGRCSRSKCVPLCQNPDTTPNDKAPDWGWENNTSCVIPTSPTALVAGG